MATPTQDIHQSYLDFINTVCRTEKVWSLKTEEGYATSDSTEYETEEGEALPLFCFWSEREMAEDCAQEGWSGYVPDEIRLPDFIENWCVAMSDEEALAGINFNPEMYGFEQEPLQLVLELADELKRQKKTLSFVKFKQIEELTKIIERLMEE